MNIAEPPVIQAHSLTIQFLRWVSEQPRSYAEAMEAWRTSCPRLSIWEHALADGLVAVTTSSGMSGGCVRTTAHHVAGTRPDPGASAYWMTDFGVATNRWMLLFSRSSIAGTFGAISFFQKSL